MDHAPAAPTAAAPTRPTGARDTVDAQQLREYSAHIVALDTRFGAGELLGPAVRSACSARRRALVGPATRDGLAAVAEAQQIAGWLAYDADRHGLAHRMTAEAVETARQAGDRSAEHFALSQLAMQAIHLRRPDQALRICDTVLEDELPPGVRTLFVMRRARAVNQYGDHAAARRLIAETYSRHLQGAGSRDPAWAWWLDTAEITWQHAMIHADNHQWTRAIPLFEQSAAGRIPHSRTAHNDHAYLLHAFAHTRARTDAAELLTSRVLPAQRTITSTRITNLLHQTAALMNSTSPHPSSQDLAHALRAALRHASLPTT
ncbi:hypothetical protein [Embleya sp. AB8]|uniref:hypothetical protein n=1 Tax=Embleya sp. AB8 TaxID=3156304 RepID=UPI003C733E98